ncbi:MAG: biopolymer transporter ExbD [Steroidobacteraceae bacterium]
MQTQFAQSFTYSAAIAQGGYAARMRKPVEVMLVPMIDIFVVLVTFLLMTAVFSRITIMQLQLPSANATDAGTPPAFRLEVIVRHAGLELTNGSDPIATIPAMNGQYDLKTLSSMALELKRQYPKATDASVLMERDIQYDHLIQVMDAIRTTEVSEADVAPVAAEAAPPVATVGVPKRARIELFTNVSVGQAP